MKLWGILLAGMIFCFGSSVIAQTNMENIFSVGNKNIIYTNQPQNYSGEPLVFIEGISDKPQPKGWMDEMKIKLFGSMDLPKQEVQKPLPPLELNNNIQNSIKINSLFNGEKEVLFTPHTNEWNFIIQVLNDEEIAIQEDILLIKNADTPSPIRNWPQMALTLLEVRINGQEVYPILKENGQTIDLFLPELDTGVHKIHLSYIVKKVGNFSKTSGKISLPLMDMGWTLPINSIKGVILFPTNIKESDVTFLFGRNKQNIKDAFDVASDSSGAIFFRSTHLIPAFSMIQLDSNFQFDSFIKKSFWDKFGESSSSIFLISLGIIFFYLILNVIEKKLTSLEEEVLKKKIRFSQNSFISFLYRTGEIWIGLMVLWGGTFIALWLMEMSFSIVEVQILFFLPIVFVLVMDYLLLGPRQKKLYLLKLEYSNRGRKKHA